MYIKDRIKELRRVPASELLPNPKNWRTHPEAQKNVLQGLLAEVGYADALIAREREDGSLELIDGHLRAETTPQQEVPVLVLDVSEAEADKILATLDPLSAMAGKNEVLLTELIQGMETQSQAVQAMLEKSLTSQEAAEPVFREEIVVPEVFQVVVECESETQQGEVYERLRSEGFQCRLLNL